MAKERAARHRERHHDVRANRGAAARWFRSRSAEMRARVIGVLGLAPVAACFFPSTGDLGGPDASGRGRCGGRRRRGTGARPSTWTPPSKQARRSARTRAPTRSARTSTSRTPWPPWSAASCRRTRRRRDSTPTRSRPFVAPERAARRDLRRYEYARLQKLLFHAGNERARRPAGEARTAACASDGDRYFELLKMGNKPATTTWRSKSTRRAGTLTSTSH